MATPKTNENCHYVKNDSHKPKIKLEKFDFDVLCRFGVSKESLPLGRNPCSPPGEIGLRLGKQWTSQSTLLMVQDLNSGIIQLNYSTG